MALTTQHLIFGNFYAGFHLLLHTQAGIQGAERVVLTNAGIINFTQLSFSRAPRNLGASICTSTYAFITKRLHEYSSRFEYNATSVHTLCAAVVPHRSFCAYSTRHSLRRHLPYTHVGP